MASTRCLNDLARMILAGASEYLFTIAARTVCDLSHIRNLASALFESAMGANRRFAMATLVKPTQSRFVRWFKQFRKTNKSPYKWYDCDNCGI